MFLKREGKPVNTPNLFNDLLDFFPDMIHSVDDKGQIISFNRTALDLLGYTAEEFAGLHFRRFYAPEVLEAVEKGFVEVKQTGEKSVETLFVAKDGTRIPVEQRTVVICDEQGGFVQTFTISRDIRKLKEMQEGMLHAGRLAAIGELAAGVVHDINNPLTAASLANSMLQQWVEQQTALSEGVREQASELSIMIREATDTIEKIVARLRDFSRGVKEQHVPVDLFVPINDALFILGHKIKAVGVTVTCPIVKARFWTFGDPNQLEQVFLNLFANACDAMAQRDTRQLTVEISRASAEGRVFLTCAVRDTGEGIRPEDTEKIFNAFHTTKPRGKGTGLGLSIARSILAEHGGEIAVQSEPGVGTVFTIRLPAYAQPFQPVRP
ncbi:MAG: ATP-binding protein [Kiritimatiellia bacterium]|jgi:PAS domain S-box-containing protein|nr:ATP-binding protein [Kiritimatiellia bacterium]